ncbi:NapB [Pasteurella multocida subsp. multocida str. Anand1_buffalo]|nr:NapB [Pasteurella multocida subsp. multocida str. Anand1_buffalo]
MLILTALFAFTVNANEVKVGKSLQDSPENIAPAFHNTPKESGLAPLNYVNQPPMVPHATKNYQVTKNINQCLTVIAQKPHVLLVQHASVQPTLWIVMVTLSEAPHLVVTSVYNAMSLNLMLSRLFKMNLNRWLVLVNKLRTELC